MSKIKTKYGKNLEIEDLYKTIEIVKNEVLMKEKTILEMDELERKCRENNYEKDFSISKNLLLKDLEEKRKELKSLERLSTGNTTELDGYIVNVNQLPSYGEELKHGEISFINHHVIKEPARENLFLVHGLEEFGLTESDIVSYNDNSSTKKLTLTIRNNVVDCPIVEFNNLANDSRNRLHKNIVIEILDPQLKPVYTMLYKEPVVRCLGDLNGRYDGYQPQLFTVTLSYRVREMEKVKKDGTTN